MILHGNQRGGARDLALHLLKDENEHVEVHELRGFVSNNLVSALNEAYAMSKATKAKQFLYSLSLNPPPEANVPTPDFLDAIEQVEDKLGLSGQPRAIVFHEKQGRRHAHAVWSRTDLEQRKAIQLSHTKLKLADVSRELYIKHGWQMPPGFMNSEERDLRNFTMAQWQQATRSGKDPRGIKAAIQECWAVSDTQGAFGEALKERGYILARGDRRGFVVLDYRCEVYAVAKWAGVKARNVRARLTKPEVLPSVAEARQQIARDVQTRLGELKTQQSQAIKVRLEELETKRARMTEKHTAERERLRALQLQQWEAEATSRQERFNRGLRGLVDLFTGKRRRITQRNERETLLAYQRDVRERDALIFRQLEARRTLQARIKRLERFENNRIQVMYREQEMYQDVLDKRVETVSLSMREPAPEYEPSL